ncbi:hypothetical protein [Paraburkholderia hospita]|uniref:hypothetical protein n=1 Tax=Paraburkholderia hospita TaxID=169430 RepID=UPI000B86F4CF|nr:hypothetical protein [Paraburkholderia hospita]
MRKLLAGDTVASDAAVALTALKSGAITVNGEFFTHELEAPLQLSASCEAIIEQRDISFDQLQKIFEEKRRS